MKNLAFINVSLSQPIDWEDIYDRGLGSCSDLGLKLSYVYGNIFPSKDMFTLEGEAKGDYIVSSELGHEIDIKIGVLENLGIKGKGDYVAGVIWDLNLQPWIYFFGSRQGGWKMAQKPFANNITDKTLLDFRLFQITKNRTQFSGL